MSRDRRYRDTDKFAADISAAIAQSNADSNIGVDSSSNWGEKTAEESEEGFHWHKDMKNLVFSYLNKFYQIGIPSQITPELFGGSIHAALDSLPSNSNATVYLQDNKSYTLSRPLTVEPGKNVIGNSSAKVIADFAIWEDGEEYIAIKFKRSTTPTYEGIANAVGQKTGGFTLVGKNNSDKITYGCWFDTDLVFPENETTNYAYLLGEVKLTILRFDIGVVIDQVWDTNFYLTMYQCRQGILVRGFAVNVFFYELRFINPSLGYTSSTEDFIGVYINDDSAFGGVQHRPEGFSFIGGLIYGMKNSFVVKNCLWVLIQGMVIDGNGGDGIVIDNPNQLNIKDNYIASIQGGSCIKFSELSTASTSSVKVVGNDLVGNAPTYTTYGVSFAATGSARIGVRIENNNGRDLTHVVYAPKMPDYSRIADNFGVNIVGALISIAAGGRYTDIDGNTTNSNQAPVLLSGATSTLIKIGKNSSNVFTTHYAGKVTLPEGQTSIELTNNIATNAELYIRAITTFTLKGDFGVAGRQWVVEGTNRASGTFHSSVAAPAGGIVIEYICQAIPYTASI